jgi:thiaminase/transcriptional activator TenA
MTHDSKSAEELKGQLRRDFERGSGFADQLRREFDDLFRKIDSHPFLVDIAEGKLPIQKFRTYAVQNYYYFAESGRALAAAASRAPAIPDAITIVGWLTNINPEFDKYLSMIRKVGVSDEQMSRALIDPAIPIPAFRDYVNYMYKVCSTGFVGEAAACLLACDWTYSSRDVGGLSCAMRMAQGLADHYGVDRETALTYGNYPNQKPDLQLMTSLKSSISEGVAKGDRGLADRIRDIFRRASEYELGVWDAVYK